MKSKLLLIECCNFIDFPAGGQLSFAKNLMNVFGSDLILVGITTDDTPVGVWIKKEFNGVIYDFLSLAKVTKSNKKPVIPFRLFSYYIIKRHKNLIIKYKNETVFIQAPEVLLAIKDWEFNKICFRFAGINNPIQNSRYRYLRLLNKLYDFVLFNALKKTDIIFASSCKSDINTLQLRMNEKKINTPIYQLYTRVDTMIFKPKNKIELREKYGYEKDATIVIYTGRLAKVKGWDLMIDAFLIFKNQFRKAIFMMIGEGEDKTKIKEYINKNKTEESIYLLGQKNSSEISELLNISDLYIMASYKEGWSTSLVEAAACHLPACTTNFSSSDDIITSDLNGYIVNKREPELFAQYMAQAIKINNLTFDISNYSIHTLKQDILKIINTL